MAIIATDVQRAMSNRNRFHEVSEIQIDLTRSGYPTSENEIEAKLKALKKEGKVEESEQGGHKVYCLTDAAGPVEHL